MEQKKELKELEKVGRIIANNEKHTAVETPTGVRYFSKINPAKFLPDKSYRWRLSTRRWLKDWFGLNPTQRSIMVCLWLHASELGECYPSERTLAGELGVYTSTILRNLKILKKKKFFEVKNRQGRKGKSSLYKLLK